MRTDKLIVFALLREGSTEDALVPHLENLVLRAGAAEALGRTRPYRGTVAEKIAALLDEPQDYNLVFIHRDADSRDADARRKEISDALAGCRIPLVVPVVPIQETEAWLLTDEAAIRSAVGRPSGRNHIVLPPLRQIEQTARPKEVLMAACLAASETTGRRHAKELKQFGLRRRTLLSRLDIDGGVIELASWQSLVDDVKAAVSQILTTVAVP